MVQAVLAAAPVAVNFPKLGILDLPVSRVAFQVFGVPVYWYGLLIASAIIIGLLLSMRHAGHYGLKSDDVMDVFIFLIPMMIVFARAYYVIFEWDYYSQDLRRIFSTREGGLAFYGGLIGGILAVVLVTRFKKINLADFLDFMVVYVPLGQAIGRWGNFFNQEAFGTNTDLPWGMISNQTSAYLLGVPGVDPFLPVHPTFLYEFLANGLIFLILLGVRRHRRFPLQVLLSYLMTYGFVRFFVEGIRTDALMFPGTAIRVSQILSAALVVVSISLFILLSRRASRRRQFNNPAGSDFVEIEQPVATEPVQSTPVEIDQIAPVENDQSTSMDSNQHDG